MRASRINLFLIYFLTSSFVTAALYTINTEYSVSAQTVEALRWARQISAQVETLSLFAQEHDETDPIAWAVKFLTSGPESRPMSIQAVHDLPIGQALETFSIQNEQNIFTYTQEIRPNEGKGIRIHIQLPPIGFLGTHSRWSNDLALLALFLLCFFLCSGLKRHLSSISSVELQIKPETTPHASPGMTKDELIFQWIDPLQTHLIELANEMKALITESYRMGLHSKSTQSTTFSVAKQPIPEIQKKTLKLTQVFARITQLTQAFRNKADSMK